MNKKTTFKLGELFCGPGGLALGAKLANVSKNGRTWNVEHAWANDIDPDTCRTYAKNITPDRPEHVIAKPVQELDLTRLPKIDAFAFGFPCNDFSIVGERKGVNGKFGPLYSYGVEVLNHFKPKWFMAENVGGLENANSGATFARILKDLEGAGNGYQLTKHLYKFEQYGVPQRRHRIIIVGIAKELGLTFRVPAPTTLHPNDQKKVKDVLDVPLPAGVTNIEPTKQSLRVIERLKSIPEGKNAWCDKVPRNLRLNVKGAKLSQIYRRLTANEPAYTITGSGGGGTHVYHWAEPRALTNRERARLQSFPDSYIFEGSKESVRKQIGMAVPPDGAKIIIQAVLKTFAGIGYPHIDSTWPIGVEKVVCAPRAPISAKRPRKSPVGAKQVRGLRIAA
jgi:DNA (cytosine-5)-methyltransferase 1